MLQLPRPDLHVHGPLPDDRDVPAPHWGGKADEIGDAWRTLERIRLWANDVWARRAAIEPSYEMREKPPALEIFKRLPRNNCRACGELTCLAFAVKVWIGEASPSQCTPVFGGEYVHLKDALVEICAGMGVVDATLAGKP